MATGSKIYIIGASGFIGTNLIRSSHFKVRPISVGRASGDIAFDLSCDDPDRIARVLLPGDYLIFLAAVSSPDICNNETDYARKVNVINTSELIAAATKKRCKVIFASSDAVFGSSETPFEDSDTPCPSSLYGEMKAEIEMRFKGSPLVKIIRFSYVIGPGDKFTEMLRVNAESGGCVDIFSGFERSVVSVIDVVIGIQKMIENWEDIPFSIINFSGPEKVAREYIAKAFREKIFPNLKFRVTEAPPEFWDSRPQVINTGCKNFAVVLGRPPLNINYMVDNWGMKL